MTEYLNLEALNGRAILMFFIAIGAGYFVIKATKHLLFGLVFLVGAVFGVGLLTDVVTMDKVKAAKNAVMNKANESFEGASEKAKTIGEMGHSTSAGTGSETNEHYKKNIDTKKK
ncbi:MAG: hypothetical protein FJ100_05350 [Deltaproteobacteria bacterium]|nr:hypothetical protein [Deltaproteobacteria bacterium]